MAKAKTDLSSLKQTHGALNTPMTIDELTGRTVIAPAQTIEEYHEILANMSDIEMQESAVELGIVPINNRSLLIDRLERQFITNQRRTVPSARPANMSKKDQEFQRKFFEGQV